MKALQTKKFVGQKSISDAAIPVQSQIKSRPFVANSAPQSQELAQKPEEPKQQGFNLTQIPIFPGRRPAMPEMLQPKQTEETLKDLPEINLAPSSGGQPMPKLVQQKMEASFGTNFSDVRIHEGSQAEKIGAQAYTQGKNIHFQPGKYQPTTQSGQELLGHELAHVQQQRAGRVTAPQSKGVAINADPQLETEADVMGAKAARGESAQVIGTASSGVQRMPTQADVVQCMRDGKEPERSSATQDDSDIELQPMNRAGIEEVVDEVYTDILNVDIPNASIGELNQIIGEQNNLLAPVALQTLISSQGQEQAGPSTQTQASSHNPSNRQTNTQDVQQEEDNKSVAEIYAKIEPVLAKLESNLPQKSELEKVAANTQQELSQEQPPQIRPSNPRRQSPNTPRRRPPIPTTERQEAERLLWLDDDARINEITALENWRGKTFADSVLDRLVELQAQLPTAQQEAERLLGSDDDARINEITVLENRRGEIFADSVLDRLVEIERQEKLIRTLQQGQQQPPQQQGQQQPTRWERTKARINKPFDNTKEPRKEVAEGIKQHETYSDQTKILGQDSSVSNVDQVVGQNLPTNDANPNSYLNLPPGETEKFGNDAAVIGMTRDDVKAVGGLLLFHDSFKKFKSAFRDRAKPKRQRIADASDGLGNMTSAVTYTGLVGTQARKGVEHHQAPGDSTSGSGALAAVKQGGTIAGTSIPFDAGKAVASVLTTVPKLIIYIDAGMKAAQRENFGGYKSMGRGVKNVADFTKSAGGAVKDVSSLAYSIEQTGGASNVVLAGAESAKIIAGGAVAPAAATVFGTAESIQGGYKFKKAYKNKKDLAEIGENPTLDQLDTIDQLKEIQKKKMKRAAISTVLGNVTLAAGVVGFSAGPAGLIAASAMGAGVGAFRIGQWGTRKLKQKMRDKGVKGFDANKTTERKNEVRDELAGNTIAILEGGISDKEKETIFSSIGLNGNKKDSAVQDVYNAELAKYLSPEELQNPTTRVNHILILKGNKNKLKQQVSWNQLSDNDFPADFARQVKKAAIDQALKKR
jgi:hypothetical protein